MADLIAQLDAGTYNVTDVTLGTTTAYTVPVATAGTIDAGSATEGGTLTVSGDNPGTLTTFQWQSSPDDVTWTDITDATAATYSPPAGSAGTYYRRVMTPAVQAAVTTPSVVLSSEFQMSSIFDDGSQGFYYDASDEGTTGLVSDQDVLDTLMDIGGTGTNAKASGAARPLYRTDGTLHWVEWDGVDSVMSGTGGWSATDAFTVMVAGEVIGSASENDGFFTINRTGTLERSQRGLTAQDADTLKVAVRFANARLPTDMRAKSVFEGQFEASQTTGVYAAINGGNFVENTANVLENTGTSFLLGEGLVGDRMNCRIYAILVVNRRLSGTERQNAVELLAGKIGVTL